MRDKVNIKKILKGVWIAYGVISIIVVLYLVDRLVCKDMEEASDRIYLNENWTVTVNGERHEDVNLKDFSFETVDRGDVVALEIVVPNDMKYRQAVLCAKIRYSAVAMYVDDKLEYEYAKDRYEDNKVTGSGYLFIDFLEEYKGKNIRLEYIATENDAFSRIEEIFLTEWKDVSRYIATSNRLPMLMGSFLVVFGVMMSLVQIFAVAISTESKNVLLLALFSICIGIWTLCYYDVMILFTIPLYKISLMEHMALFIAPLPILCYMYSYVKDTNSKKIAWIYNVLTCVQTVLTVVAIILHTMNVVHGPEMLNYFQTLFIVHLMFLCYVIFIRKKRNVKLSRFTKVGLFVVAVCVFYELITYLASRYFGVGLIQIKGISSIGLTIFIGILVVDLYQRITENIMEEHEKELLIKRAYTDDLTQLHNRTYCSEHMRQLSVVKKTAYTIINFDLNGLKQMNDTYGHTKGDELICYAALVLEKTFAKEGVVGRMGGDEFIAIIENDNTEFIDRLLGKLDKNIQEVNERKHDLNLSISYGYATNTELEGGSSERVYQLADERMYAYKQEVKKALS